MQKHLIAASIAFTFIFAQPSFSMPSKPEKCPSVSALQAATFESVIKDTFDWVVVANTSNYDTNDQWTFAISRIDANNSDEALTKAKAILKTMESIGGPIPWSSDTWGCGYVDGSYVYMGVALSPPVTVPSASINSR